MSTGAQVMAALVILAGALGLSVATMVNGYGLHIESWGWIVGGAFGQGVLWAIASSLTD